MPNTMPITPYTGNLLDLQRKQAIAQMLQQQSMTPTQSETAGGYVVPQSPLQGVAQLLKAYMGTKMAHDVNSQYGDIYGKMSDQLANTNPYSGTPDPNSFSATLHGEAPAQAPADPRAAELWRKGMAYEMMGQTDAAKAAFQAANAFASPTPEMKNYTWQGIAPEDVKAATQRELASKGLSPTEQLLGNLNNATTEQQKQVYGNALGLVPNAEQQIQNAQKEREIANQERQTYYQTGMGPNGQAKTTSSQATAGMTPKQASEYNAKIAAEKPKAEASLGNTMEAYDRLENFAKEIKSDPALWRVTGTVGVAPDVPGSEAANLRAKMKAMNSQIMLNAMQALKQLSQSGATGFGQLSNKEGEILQNSISALDTSQSPEAYKKQMDVLIKAIEASKSRLTGAYKTTYGAEPNFSTQSNGWRIIP